MRIIQLLFWCSIFSAHLFFASAWTQEIDRVLAEKEKQLQEAAQKKKKIHQLLYSCDAIQGYDYLITWFEWQELQVSEYVRIFDRTQTIAGTWGLEQLTKPIVQGEVIKKRQEGVAQLSADPNFLYKFSMLLADLKKNENDLLSYFDEHNQLCRNGEQLYYTYFQSVLNKSKAALDYAYVVDSCHAVTNIASFLCITGLVNEFIVAQLHQRPMHFLQGIKKGFSGILHDHSLDDTAYQKYKANNAFAVSDEQVAQPVHRNGISGFVSSTYTSTAQAIQSLYTAISRPAAVNMLFYGSFGDKWSYFKEQASMGTTLAFLWVLGQTAYQDHRLWLSIRQNYTRLVFLYTAHVALQQRLCGVARWCADAQDLISVALNIDALREHPIVKRASDLCADDASSKIQELFKQLRLSTFAEKKCMFYSRGQVLITHALLREIKDQLLPIMQAVGLIDGYISVCSLYDACKNDPEHPFCLVRLSEDSKPLIKITDGWLPLITKNQVHNSISLGGEGSPRNMVLTGPNGGGKSSILKCMGGIAVLAHSWGIVPARACSMSVFAGLRTSFNPSEDISQDLSTFMAQKKRLDQLRGYVQSADKADALLLLIDEPYRGTIEAEAEKRAYQLGEELDQYANCMTVMASHLQLPIKLAQSGNFFNRHLAIVSEGDSFKRTFKLCDGVAEWWFNDIEKRIRFIDWLHAHL